jgi:hypothetical protein
LGFKLSVAQEHPELSFGHGLRLGHSKRDLTDVADCFQKLKGLADRYTCRLAAIEKAGIKTI